MQLTEADLGRQVIRRDGVVDTLTGYTGDDFSLPFMTKKGNTYTYNGSWYPECDDPDDRDLMGFVEDEDDPVLLSEKHIGALVILRDGTEATVERVIASQIDNRPIRLDNNYWYSTDGRCNTMRSDRDIIRVEALATQVDDEVLITDDDIGRLVRLRGGDTTRINVCLEDGLYRVRASNGRTYSPDGREYAGSITTNDIVDFIAEETDDGPVEDDKPHLIGEGLDRVLTTDSKDPFDQLVTLYINSSDPIFRRIIRLGMLRLGQQAEVSSE